MAPWDEKVPGVSGQSGGQQTDAQSIMKGVQNMIDSITKFGQTPPGGQAIVPGQVPPGPEANIQFQPGRGPNMPITPGAPIPPMRVPPTGNQSLGYFTSKGQAANAGMVSLGNSLSGLFSAVEEKQQAKKVSMAEGYMNQINALLASGDPGDRHKAEMILEDPKVLKMLKQGLGYVPLQEPAEAPPPEAIGVANAMNKTANQMGAGPQRGGGQPQAQQMRPILPQPSQQQQIQSAMYGAVLDKLRKDPASALQMAGVSQLSSTEQRATEFYTAGLGMSPTMAATMNQADKLAGMKIYEQLMRDSMRLEVDMYRSQQAAASRMGAADVAAGSRIDVAKIQAAAKDRLTNVIAEIGKDKNKRGAAINYAAGARMYEDMAKEWLRLSKQPGISDEEKARYEAQSQIFQQQADDFLNQEGSDDFMNELMDLAGGRETPPEE